MTRRVYKQEGVMMYVNGNYKEYCQEYYLKEFLTKTFETSCLVSVL